ncbi:MAG TPA: hypothetical protein DD733_05745 [Clostridiales bacterium]|nr:hypothetical protein [Eubacteriales bacterium]HBR31566.1 hypothetical protein [Clostridiales bacterium]
MKKTSTLKHLSLCFAIVILLCATLLVPVSADNTVLANLMPSHDTDRGNLTLTGCTMEENANGSVTFTLTESSASINMVFAEGLYKEGSGTIYNDEPIDLSKPAYFVYDYASADGVTFGSLIAHYTRKDKSADNKNADLFLNSMEGSDYKDYQKVAGEGYGIWDWGQYVTEKKDGLFDDKIHRFTYLEGTLSGTIGSKLTIYSYYVSSTDSVDGLGAIRPKKAEPEESDVSETQSIVSEAESIDESVPDESDTSSAEESKELSSDAEPNESKAPEKSEAENSEKDTGDEDGLKPIYYVLIVAGALIIIGVIAFAVMKKKK